MRFNPHAVLIMSTVVLLGAPIVARAQPKVELAIKGSDRPLKMQDLLECEVRVLNSTKDPIWIFGDLRWGMRGGVVLNVSPWERDGPLPLFIDHAEFTDEELHDRRSFVRLRPGAFIGRKREIKVSELVRKPGEYRVWLEYTAPLPAVAFDEPFWSAEKGSLFSAAVVLRIVPDSPPDK